MAVVVGVPTVMKRGVLWLCTAVPAVALAAAWRRLSRWWARAAERRQRPRALRDAELVHVEKQFRSKGRWPVMARVDRAYRLPSGMMVLVELKTRSSPVGTGSDIIQLSAQRVALMDASEQRVSGQAFVLFSGTAGTPPYFVRKVKLLSREEIDAMVQRRRRLLRGLEQPDGPVGDVQCRHCGLRDECRAAGSDLRARRRLPDGDGPWA